MILGIYGSGGLGRELMHLSKEINAVNGRWEKTLFIDDVRKEKVFKDTEVYSFTDLCNFFTTDAIEITIAVGEIFFRMELKDKVKEAGYHLATLIHPSVYIPDDTSIGEGTVICMSSFVSTDTKIGGNVVIMPNTYIGHDNLIGDNCFISSLVSTAGFCKIGKNVYIGMGTAVKEKTIIGDESIVGMGSVVVKDIPENTVAYGNPAKSVKQNNTKRVFL